MPAPLEGRIKGLSLSAFLQISEMEETSCTLKVTSDENHIVGHLYLLKGQLIGAETDTLKNLEAAYEIISWENTEIEIKNEVKKTENRINQPLMNILMDALRVKDEKAGTDNLQDSSGIKDTDMELQNQDLDDSEDELDFPELELEPSFELENAPEDQEADVLSPATPSNQPQYMADMWVGKKIEAFQKKIAIPCPICRKGQIHASATSDGREYYACSNDACGFKTWEKPYNFKCPLCANPFLIEFSINTSGGMGLKCPKTTCSFQQGILTPPDAGKKSKKRIRVVKRKPRNK
jgi:hypothetical protein